MNEIDRFLAKISTNDGECWLWKAAKTQQGYGVFSSRGKSIPAHRFAFIHYKEAIPDKYIIHQTCQHNDCVNPEHLICCTKSESRLKYNSTRVHPDAKKLIQQIRIGDVEINRDDFGFGEDVL